MLYYFSLALLLIVKPHVCCDFLIKTSTNVSKYVFFFRTFQIWKMKRNNYRGELTECRKRYGMIIEWKSGISLIVFLQCCTLFVDLCVTPFQVENVRNYDKMLQAARSLRVEREKEQSLARQKLEQKNQVKLKFLTLLLKFLGQHTFSDYFM